MKLRVLSDLHIEFHPFLIPEMDDDRETVLVLAGDIGVIHRRTELESFLRAAAAQFRAVIYVLGNHEYYRGIWPDAIHALRAWDLPNNIHVLERGWVRIDNIVFVGATLWSDFQGGNLQVMQDAEQTLNDFHYIAVTAANGSTTDRLSAAQVLNEFRETLTWLDDTLTQFARQGDPVVLVTHHGISRMSIHETYRDNPLNGAFVSDCSDLIERTRPKLVIHGHVHNSFDYRVGGCSASTRVVVNPRGYTRSDDTQENPVFDPGLTIELEVQAMNRALNDDAASRTAPADGEPPSLARAYEVVDFWRSVGTEGWFAKNDDVDRRFEERFSDLHFAAAQRRCDHWMSDPYAGLALLLLLDQFPRNVFRGTGHMFATDPLARYFAAQYVEQGLIESIDQPLRLFACLPFAHSENIDDQDYALTLYRRYAPDSMSWAENHHSIVTRFGRFPHRNAALGRVTTAAEQQFLDDGGFAG